MIILSKNKEKGKIDFFQIFVHNSPALMTAKDDRLPPLLLPSNLLRRAVDNFLNLSLVLGTQLSLLLQLASKTTDIR